MPLKSPARIAVFLATASAIGVFGISGCIGTPTSGLERMQNAIVLGEMSIDEPPIDINTVGMIDLEVESFGGTVRIEAVPGMVGTVIEPVLRSYHGNRRRGESIDTLDHLHYRVEMLKGELDRETLLITTWSDDDEDHYQAIDFFIQTGSVGSVKVRTERGRVWVKDNQHGVDIETTQGDVRVVTQHPMTEPMTMVTKSADIDFRASAGSGGHYDVESIGGHIYQRFTHTRITATSPDNGQSVFVAQVGESTAPVTIRTTYGDVRVAIVDDPLDVGPIIKE